MDVTTTLFSSSPTYTYYLQTFCFFSSKHKHKHNNNNNNKMNWQKKLIDPFHLFTVTLLSLLLPLAFLLLSRLSCAHYLLSFTSYPPPTSSNFLLSLFLNANPTLLHLLVSVVSVATLVHSLTGKVAFVSTDSAGEIYRPGLQTAWIFLCALQVCVGLGIEGSVVAGIDGANLGKENSSLSRLVFFLGLHETMTHWSRTVVKPVVDDTVYGGGREERWGQRVALAVSCGTLWWWRLRDEVEALVVVAEMKREVGVAVADFVGWWLYYLTVTVGMVRVVKAVMWVGMVLLCRRVRVRENGNNDLSSTVDDRGRPSDWEEKV